MVKDDYVNVSLCTGTMAEVNSGVNVFPNPSAGFVTVSFGDITNNATLKVSDAVGKIVYTAEKINTTQNYSLDLSGIKNGMYFLTVTSEDKQVVKKIIIRK
jgi:hypothetical protein